MHGVTNAEQTESFRRIKEWEKVGFEAFREDIEH